MNFGPKYKWFKISDLNSFFKILFRAYNFFIFVCTFQWTWWEFFLTKANEKNHSFYNTVSLKKPHSFYQINLNLNLNDIEHNMLQQHSQKPFSLYKFSSKHISVWCQKKHLQKWCSTISWRPRTAFLKHFDS